MKAIGFDIGKDTIIAARTDHSYQSKEVYSIANNRLAIKKFLVGLMKKHPTIIAGVESTGDYHRLLALACLKKKVPLRLLNPITTKQFTKATVRQKKTDQSDALIIAKLTLQKEGRLITEQDFLPVKSILRVARQLVKLRQSLRLTSDHFQSILPEEQELIVSLDDCQKQFDKTIENYRERADQEIDPAIKSLLTSIPGVGKIIAGVLIAEIGDINRFSSVDSLVAYAGLDPKVRQSGTSLHRNTRITKRGSPYLRHSLFQAALTACRCDPELKRYYQKKRKEGKQFREAMVAAARKMLTRIYAVWKRQTPYVKSTT